MQEYDGVVRVDSTDDVAIFDISGEADLRITRDLRARIDEAAARPGAHVLIDLTRATFIDSSTLGAIAFSAKAFAERPGHFAVVCPPGEIREMFQLTALERLVPLHDTREEALASFGEVPETT
jgi:anti-sigma B factor antagonist